MTDALRFCPDCGSAGVEFSTLAGGSASCKGCSWKGRTEDLPLIPVRSDLGTSETVLLQIVNDLRRIMSKDMGVVLLQFLLKWGFVSGDPSKIKETVNVKEFSRYLSTITRMIVAGIMEERSKIERERVVSAVESN